MQFRNFLKENGQLESAVEAATLAFWDAVAKSYPEIKTGDLDPGAEHAFTKAAATVIKQWVEANSQ